MNTTRDETLEEIWAIRRQIAKKFAADPHKRVAYYQRKQKDSGAKIYRPVVTAETTLHALDILHDHTKADIAVGQFETLTSYCAPRKRKGKPAK
jgi:hypothetical protein